MDVASKTGTEQLRRDYRSFNHCLFVYLERMKLKKCKLTQNSACTNTNAGKECAGWNHPGAEGQTVGATDVCFFQNFESSLKSNPPTPTDGTGERVREAITSMGFVSQGRGRSKKQE